jgi:hypothetical protein
VNYFTFVAPLLQAIASGGSSANPSLTAGRFGLINRGEIFPRASVARWVARKLAAHFAALLVLPTDCCVKSYACEAAIFSKERASWRVVLANKEAPRIELLNHYHFDEVVPGHGCTWT